MGRILRKFPYPFLRSVLLVLLFAVGPLGLGCGGGDDPIVPQGDPCTDNSGCGLGEVCDAGTCRLARCDREDFTCPTGKVCDAGTGSCRTARCDRGDIQCASGEVCDTGRCRAKRCERGDFSCSGNQVCNPSSGQCEACDPLTDDGCEGGGGGGGGSQCNNDIECPDVGGVKRACDNGTCRVARCDLDPEIIDCEALGKACDATTGACRDKRCDLPEDDIDCEGNTPECDETTGQCVPAGGCSGVEFSADENETNLSGFDLPVSPTDPTLDFGGIQLLGGTTPLTSASIIGTFEVETVGSEKRPLVYRVDEDGNREQILDARAVACTSTLCPGLSDVDDDFSGRTFYRYDLPIDDDEQASEVHAFLPKLVQNENLFWPVYRCGDNHDFAVEEPEKIEVMAATVTCSVAPWPSAPYLKVTVATTYAVSAQIKVSRPPTSSGGPLTYDSYPVTGGSGEFYVPIVHETMKIGCEATGVGTSDQKWFKTRTGQFPMTVEWQGASTLTSQSDCAQVPLKFADQTVEPNVDDSITHGCHAMISWQASQKLQVTQVEGPNSDTSVGSSPPPYTIPWVGKVEVVPYRQGNEAPSSCGPTEFSFDLRDYTSGGVVTDPSLIAPVDGLCDKPPPTGANPTTTQFLDTNCVEILTGTNNLMGRHGVSRTHLTCNRYKLKVWQIGYESSSPTEKTLDLRYRSEFKWAPYAVQWNVSKSTCNVDENQDVVFRVPWKGQHLKENPTVRVFLLAQEFVKTEEQCTTLTGCYTKTTLTAPRYYERYGLSQPGAKELYYGYWQCTDASLGVAPLGCEEMKSNHLFKTTSGVTTPPHGHDINNYQIIGAEIGSNYGPDDWPESPGELGSSGDKFKSYVEIKGRYHSFEFQITATGVDGQIHTSPLMAGFLGACGDGPTFDRNHPVLPYIKLQLFKNFVHKLDVPEVSCGIGGVGLTVCVQSLGPGYYCDTSVHKCKLDYPTP